MITPRPYLSWSSLDLLEHSEAKWKDLYFYGEQRRANSGMVFGRKMADSLENEEASGDIILDLLIERIPKFEIMDKTVDCLLPNGKNPIPILIKPDTMKTDMTAFKEYKTGQEPWTKKRADESGQITFYATGLYLKSGKIPADIELVWVQTEKQSNGWPGGKIGATGDIRRFKTVRTMADILKMMVRMKKAWERIQIITTEELL
jgi:hypothetical protein